MEQIVLTAAADKLLNFNIKNDDINTNNIREKFPQQLGRRKLSGVKSSKQTIIFSPFL
jgi:hypothetical protein